MEEKLNEFNNYKDSVSITKEGEKLGYLNLRHNSLIAHRVVCHDLLDYLNPLYDPLMNAIVQRTENKESNWLYNIVLASQKIVNVSEQEILNSDFESVFEPKIWNSLNEEEKELMRMCKKHEEQLLSEHKRIANEDEEKLLKLIEPCNDYSCSIDGKKEIKLLKNNDSLNKEITKIENNLSTEIIKTTRQNLIPITSTEINNYNPSFFGKTTSENSEDHIFTRESSPI